MISAETYYRQSSDLITRVVELRDDNRIWMTSQNINKDYNYGIELSMNWTVFQWLRLNLTSNYFQNNLVELQKGVEEIRRRNVFNANGMLSIIPTRSTFIQLLGYYSGPRNLPNYGEQKESFSVGFAVRQEFFNRKLSITFRGQDLLGTAKREFINYGSNFTTRAKMSPESSVFYLSISYTFNDFRRPQRRDENIEIDMQDF